MSAAEDGSDLLAEIAALYAAADPVPADLADRILFALELDGLDHEMARLEERLVGADGSRGAEHARSVTFASDSLTVMITISPLGPLGNRVDGWASPGHLLPVELRTGQGSVHTRADEEGRFEFDRLPAGRIQLIFHIADGPDGSSPRQVVTPAVEL